MSDLQQTVEWLNKWHAVSTSNHDSIKDKLRADTEFFNQAHHSWPAIAEELTRLESECERLRQIYIGENVSRCKHEIALNATEDRVSELLRENQRLREFEAAVRYVKKYGDLDRWPGEIDVAIDDLDTKRGK